MIMLLTMLPLLIYQKLICENRLHHMMLRL